MCSTKATIIYLDSCMMISKKPYQDWREIQEEYWEHYKASLTPLTCEEIVCYFKEDFGEETHWPFSKGEIISFFEGNSETIKSGEIV